jgi:hypothetical protein
MKEQDAPDDLIPLCEACKRGPRPARGKRRHRSTVLRWVLAGQLRGWRVRGNWFVSEAELADFLRPREVEVPATQEAEARREAAERARRTDEVLRAHGLR